MKAFTVQGLGWENDVNIDDTVFEKYGDMAFEAMTQALQNFFDQKVTITDYSKEPKLGWFTYSYEAGFDGNPDKTIITLTENVLRNAGYYSLADEVKEDRMNFYKNDENNIDK